MIGSRGQRKMVARNAPNAMSEQHEQPCSARRRGTVWPMTTTTSSFATPESMAVYMASVLLGWLREGG